MAASHADRLIIFDTTLRDGEQSPGASMNTEQKMLVARALEALGVDVIEAGFPIASPGDFDAVKKIGAEIRGCTIAALARCGDDDIRRAGEALRGAARPRVHVFLATSDIHLEHKLRMSRDQALERISAGVRLAREYTDDVEFSCEDATRSHREFLVQAVKTACAAGATTLNIPDTVGYTTPVEYGDLIASLIGAVPELKNRVVSAHCHDDLGMAVANSLAAVRAGARQVEGTINGIGERAGNASIEEIVMAVRTRPDQFRVTTAVVTERIYPTSRLVASATGISVPPNKAIVGRNAFAHEAGIHQHGMLQNALTYEIMRPETVGRAGSVLVLGKHSGKHALGHRFKELGYTLSKEELADVYGRFCLLADKKKAVYDEDLIALLQSGAGGGPARVELVSYQVITGTNAIPSATVILNMDGARCVESATGDGPLDALFKAIDQGVGESFALREFSLTANTEGQDALGEAHLAVEADGAAFHGKGLNTDIIVACVQAYLQAVNRALAARAAAERI